MGRLVDIGAVCKTIKEGWDGVSGEYRAKDIIDFTIFDVEQMEGIEAIPVDWIKRYMKEVGLTDVKYMLETWEKEQIYGKTD